MINIATSITSKNNLLAFSGGVDSTALFFILLSLDIPFDIAIVNYNQRESSKDEVQYAENLALKHNKKCFIKEYENEKFSEKLARDFRYDFFKEIIKENDYKSLITAHQLNDKFEWFLMQLSKGAGLTELIGLQEIEIRESFTLYRPLLEISKNELLEYLDKNNIKYFIDETNSDTKYKRNFVRQKFSDEFIKLYKDGLKKSFSYLQKDVNSLQIPAKQFSFQKLLIMRFDFYDENIIMRILDKELKMRAILMSAKTRDEILRKKSVVVSHKICVEIVENILWIAPFEIKIMDKKFKERCRICKIPKNVRSYLSTLKTEEFENAITQIQLL